MLVALLYLTLCDPMDCSLSCFAVCGVLQARILEWVAIPFSRIFSRPRDWTWVSHIAGRFFTIWAAREPQSKGWFKKKFFLKYARNHFQETFIHVLNIQNVFLAFCVIRYVLYNIPFSQRILSIMNYLLCLRHTVEEQ